MDCVIPGASYWATWPDGRREWWSTWFRVTDGKFMPAAVEVYFDMFDGLPPC